MGFRDFKPETYKWLPLFILMNGLGAIFLAFILSIGGFNFMLRTAVKYKTRIVDGSSTYLQWKDIPIYPLMKVRFFNITNPDDIPLGKKPIVQEVGPYVYSERLYKQDITFFEETKTVKYHQFHEYFFEPTLSSGLESDLLTIINLPFVAVAHFAMDFTNVDYLHSELETILRTKGETLIRRETVRDILFDGIDVKPYLDLMKMPMVQYSGHNFELPEILLDGRMGILEGRNNTHQGWIEVKTGVGNYEEFGNFVAYQEKRAMSVWNGRSCNEIRGSDGMIYPPFIHDTPYLEIFIPEMCRALRMDFTKKIRKDIIPGRRYQLTEKTFQSPRVNPANACYCLSKNLSDCDINGFFSIAPCLSGAPIFISHPHFLFLDDKIQSSIIGMDPSPDLHWGFMDMNPTTGVTIQAKHRFQFNLHMKPHISMKSFENLTEMFLPILWLEEAAEMVGLNKYLLQLLEIVEVLFPLGMVGMVFYGVVMCPAVAYYILNKRNRNLSSSESTTNVKAPDDDEEDSD